MSYATYWWMVSMSVYSLLKQYIVSLHSELHRDGFIFKSLHVLINTATEHIGVSVRVGAALSPLVTGRAGNVSHCVSSCQCQMICCWHVAPTATNWLMFFFFLWCVWLFGTAYWLNNSQIWFVFTSTRHSNGILEQRHWLIYNKQLCSQIGRKKHSLFEGAHVNLGSTVEVAGGATAQAHRHERVNGRWNRFYWCNHSSHSCWTLKEAFRTFFQ